jgi:hypothetical protein
MHDIVRATIEDGLQLALQEDGLTGLVRHKRRHRADAAA